MNALLLPVGLGCLFLRAMRTLPAHLLKGGYAGGGGIVLVASPLAVCAGISSELAEGVDRVPAHRRRPCSAGGFQTGSAAGDNCVK